MGHKRYGKGILEAFEMRGAGGVWKGRAGWREKQTNEYLELAKKNVRSS